MGRRKEEKNGENELLSGRIFMIKLMGNGSGVSVEHELGD